MGFSKAIKKKIRKKIKEMQELENRGGCFITNSCNFNKPAKWRKMRGYDYKYRNGGQY